MFWSYDARNIFRLDSFLKYLFVPKVNQFIIYNRPLIPPSRFVLVSLNHAKPDYSSTCFSSESLSKNKSYFIVAEGSDKDYELNIFFLELGYEQASLFLWLAQKNMGNLID